LVGHRALNKESLPGKWYHCNAYSFRFNWFLRDFEVNCKTFCGVETNTCTRPSSLHEYGTTYFREGIKAFCSILFGQPQPDDQRPTSRTACSM